MHNHEISSIWLADLTYTQQTIAADVMPNAIGCIASYTEKVLSLDIPIRIFKYPEKLVDALDKEGAPDVIGFSNYVWNCDLSYGFAKRIKEVSPDTVVIFGGPNYPTDEQEQSDWLKEHGDIDFYLIKEGEIAFSNLIQALIDTNGNIEGVKNQRLLSTHSYLDNGDIVLTPSIERLTDLTQIPSPYTTGLMDEFFDGKLLPIIQTNRGCPFGCTFCVEGVNYYNKVRRNTVQKVDDELDYIGKKMKVLREDGGRNDLFIADSNFAMYKDDIETAKSLAHTRKIYGWPEYINVATGKNQKERVLEASRIIDGALRLSGSVQSLDPGVLENIKRKNIDAQGLFDLGLQAEAAGANTYSEIILGLPGDSLKAHLSTIETVMNAGFTNIYLFQLMLLPGTEMATLESKEKYGMDVRYRVLPRCYGYYDVMGKRIVTAEIEEICVASNTLSFDDYLAARRFHLVITIYHNDGVFAGLLKLLRTIDVPVYKWMELLSRNKMPTKLSELFDSFVDATSSELWENREELENFIQQAGIVEKFIAGEEGNNLLFVHKTLAITEYLKELADFAKSTIRECIEDSGKNYDDFKEFINDTITYHYTRALNLFSSIDENPIATLNYNVAAYIDSDTSSNIEDYRLAKPTEYHFILDESQKGLIQRYLGIYGSDTVAVGRILSKVHVKKLYRHALQGADLTVKSNDPAESNKFFLSGLQE